MATIALSRPVAPHRTPSNISSLTSTITLENLSNQPSPCPVPNKHIPVCPPGPIPQEEPSTPPPSPVKEEDQVNRSLLSPPDKYSRLEAGRLSLYKIDATQVAAALHHLACQPLPDPAQVFPWLHGLHPNNQIQQTFFMARKRALRRTPPCLRGITVVKADGDLSVSRLKGAIAPHEFLQLDGAVVEFLDVDPREGFSVRNFQIQAAKSAMTSDIIVYGDDEAAVHKLAWDVATAQQRWRDRHDAQRHRLPEYNTFICVCPFAEFEERHPELVAVNSAGLLTGNVLDLFHQERREMYDMTRASEISHNVWLGPTPEPGSEDELAFDVLIECSDLGRLNPAALQAICERAHDYTGPLHLGFPSSGSILAPTWSHAEADGILETCKWIYHLAHGTHPSLLENLPTSTTAAAAEDADGDTSMTTSSSSSSSASPPPPDLQLHLKPHKILIHCADGYTESTMLAVAYSSYSTGRPVPDAWLNLHTVLRRNCFAYPSDVALLSAIAPRLLAESPVPVCAPDRHRREGEGNGTEQAAEEGGSGGGGGEGRGNGGKTLAAITAVVRDEPRWFAGFDGSFPSRILDYMYLGNLGHANNPDLLRAMGIGQILSVGETAMWRDGELEAWGEENVCVVQGVQDNGIDPLTDEFERCLAFIDRGRARGTATLVHCRVGVSRSATICIAEVMRSRRMSFPRAYCFVRARRLNVIIQPHLRFAYELLKWEETLSRGGWAVPGAGGSKGVGEGDEGGQGEEGSECGGERGSGLCMRELEWGEIAREVALLNRPYAR
ncbi:hypothetical protein VTK26DRAFT_5015 [Humicola hyalothermophila]